MAVLALVVRLPGLSKSLYYDELWATGLKVGEPFLLLRHLYYDSHPPLYLAFMHLWTRLFGDSELAIRMPSLILGVSSVPLLVHLGTRFGSRRLGIVAGLLLALAPPHVWASQAARSYAITVFLTLASVWALQRCRDGGRWRAALFAALLSLCMLSHFYAALFALVFFAASGSIGGTAKWRVRIAVVVASLPLGAFLAVKMALTGLSTGKWYARTLNLPEAWDLMTEWMVFCRHLPWEQPLQGIGQIAVALLLVHGALVLWRRTEHGRWLVACLLVMPTFLWLLQLFGVTGSYLERSVVAAVPFAMLTLAASVTSWSSAIARYAATGLVVAGFGVSLAVFLARQPTDEVANPLPDWRPVAAYLAREADTAPVPRTALTMTSVPVRYYAERVDEASNVEGDDSESLAVRSKLVRFLGDGQLTRWLAAGLEDQVYRLLAWKEANRVRTRIVIRPTRPRDVVRMARAHANEHDRVAFVIGRTPLSKVARDVLRSGKAEVLAERDFGAITVLKLRLE